MTTVGSKNQPVSRSAGRPPPTATVAPCSAEAATMPSSRSRWRSLIMGPTSVSGSVPAPRRSFSTWGTTRSTNSSTREPPTRKRWGEMQTWPALRYLAATAPGGHGLQVGVGEDQHRGVAAQLQRQPGDRLGRPVHQQLADPHAAGEVELAQGLVVEHGLAHALGLAVDDVEDAGRQARLLEDAGQVHAGHGGELRRAADHRAARGQRGGHGPGDVVGGEVPGRDRPRPRRRAGAGRASACPAPGWG